MEPKQGLEAAMNLVVYGPLGVLALLGIIVSVKLYLDGRRDRRVAAAQLKKDIEGWEEKYMESQTKHANEREAWTTKYNAERELWNKQLKDERENCEKERKEAQDQMRTLEERYITKADNNLEKYHALAESMNRVLDSATRRYPNAGGPHGRGKDSG